MNHTPGPGTVNTINGREVSGPPDSGVIVASLPEWGILADCPDQAPANARLIAAAPDLLAALQLCYRFINGGSGLYPGLHHEAYIAARAAIRAAIGEE